MKLNFTIYGYGNHFKNKIAPCLKKFKSITIKNIISRKKNKDKKIYNIINNENANNTFYISTPIDIHYSNLKEILNFSKKIRYVFCEKSITNDLKKTREIVKLYNIKKIFLIETYMYIYHPQFLMLKKILTKRIVKKPYSIFCRYTIPKLNKGDHRNNNTLTGGNIYEIGCYPISLIYFIFKIRKKDFKYIKIVKKIINKDNTLIEFIFNKNKFILSWGYGLNYRNNFKFYSQNNYINVNKIFGKRISDISTLSLLESSKKKMHKKFSNSDNFYFMFKSCFNLIRKSSNRKKFYNEILDVAELIDYFKKLT